MRGLAERTKELIDLANQILAEDHPQTLRQLHYRIFSAAAVEYENDMSSYRRLCRILARATRAYRAWELDGEVGEPPEYSVPWQWIMDEMRKPERVSVWVDASKYAEAVSRSYRRDNWQDQPEYIELWGEKATVLGAMRPIVHKWGIVLRVCRGFGSAAMENQVGQLFEGINKPITVLYVGDHDPSGRMIETDMHRRVQIAAGVEFAIRRVAIHRKDIQEFKLPPQRIKESTHDTEGFRKQFGDKTVELEALPSRELKMRVERAITDHIDFERWDQQVMVQDYECQRIREFGDFVKNLPQVTPRLEAGS
jgi:hypothetical protein